MKVDRKLFNIINAALVVRADLVAHGYDPMGDEGMDYLEDVSLKEKLTGQEERQLLYSWEGNFKPALSIKAGVDLHAAMQRAIIKAGALSSQYGTAKWKLGKHSIRLPWRDLPTEQEVKLAKELLSMVEDTKLSGRVSLQQVEKELTTLRYSKSQAKSTYNPFACLKKGE